MELSTYSLSECLELRAPAFQRQVKGPDKLGKLVPDQQHDCCSHVASIRPAVYLQQAKSYSLVHDMPDLLALSTGWWTV